MWGPSVDQLLSAAAGGTRAWAISDPHGTIDQWVDSSGNLLAGATLDSFGNPATHSTTTPESLDLYFSYTGKYRDPLTGEQYNNARWYDPATGRFLSHDPIEADANSYRYANNDPMNRIDPTGLQPQNQVAPNQGQATYPRIPYPIDTLISASKQNDERNGGMESILTARLKAESTNVRRLFTKSLVDEAIEKLKDILPDPQTGVSIRPGYDPRKKEASVQLATPLGPGNLAASACGRANGKGRADINFATGDFDIVAMLERNDNGSTASMQAATSDRALVAAYKNNQLIFMENFPFRVGPADFVQSTGYNVTTGRVTAGGAAFFGGSNSIEVLLDGRTAEGAAVIDPNYFLPSIPYFPLIQGSGATRGPWEIMVIPIRFEY